MDCVFIRHGIAVEPEEWDGPEPLRPLTKKGTRRVQRAAAGLASMNVSPTRLLSSPFARAKQTASLIRSVLAPNMEIEIVDELAVGSTPERLLVTLRRCSSDSVVLCVGHEPLLGAIISLLLCGRPGQNFPMKKAGASLIHLPGGIGPGLGQLRWWIEPSQLRLLGKGRQQGRHAKEDSDD